MLNSRTLMGAVLVALGFVFLLDRANVVDAGTLISNWWPAVLVLAGILALTDRPRRPIAATVLMVIGVALLSITTGLLSAEALSVLGPVALIALGLWFVTGRRLPRSVVDSGDAVSVTAMFSGQELANTSPQFEGGTLTGIFGGVELDLLYAQPAPDAELNATALFGGVEITVPDDWCVTIDGPAIFGGFENSSRASTPGAPTLKVRALAMFGAVEIKTARRPADATIPASNDARVIG